MVSINKTRGVYMAGFDPAKAARMNALAQQYPKAPIGTLATLARIPVSELGNYTTDSVGTRASNANFGRVTSEASQNVQSTDTARNTPGSGTAFQGGGTIAEQAFGKRPQQDPFPAPPPSRPARVQDSDVDFTDAYGEDFRQAEPIPTPVVQPQDDDVDFADAYGENFREVTPIPTDTRFPTSRTEDLTQNTVDPGLANALRDQERRAIEASNAFEEPPAPDPYPAPPPARPVESFDAPVDDFSGYPVTQVDDFSGPSRNISQVDDFSGYPAAPQVDDFADIPAPAQVDDFSAYSNNNFGTEDPGLDAFGPGPTPPPPANVQEYQQFDAFGDVVEPQSQVDSFDEYSNNDFGIADEQDFSDFATPNQVNTFGVDDFGDPEAAQFDEFGDPLRAPADVNPFGVDDFGDPEVAQFDEFGDPILAADEVVENDGDNLLVDDPFFDDEEGDGTGEERVGTGDAQAGLDGPEQAAINAMALKQKAQQQQTVNELREASGVKNADGDWRVKLRLAPQATYLYKDPNPGILAPLAVTDGIIFPYTPTIDVQYRADYTNYSPTHSNYMHYFYKGSSVQTVQLQAEFTAQDTVEAEYLLATIHFLKSCSKMFYGQDPQRGSPPPLVYLTGLGEYQFNEAPCAITEFNLNLPNDVNYIRARSRHIKRDDALQFQKPLATSTTNGNFSALNRLKTAVTNALNGASAPLQAGAQPFRPSPGNLGSKGATYVPTKMSMTINMLPIVSRQQVSQQFSLKEYANGNLIKKGMW